MDIDLNLVTSSLLWCSTTPIEKGNSERACGSSRKHRSYLGSPNRKSFGCRRRLGASLRVLQTIECMSSTLSTRMSRTHSPIFRLTTAPPDLPSHLISMGHFAHFAPGSRDFLAVHMYGSVRRVLDIFESYLGQRIEWPFRQDYPRLEIIPLIDWDNAQSGYGYIEFGQFSSTEGVIHPYGLNFDVIAHEIGHTIVFSLVGFPATGQMSPRVPRLPRSLC